MKKKTSLAPIVTAVVVLAAAGFIVGNNAQSQVMDKEEAMKQAQEEQTRLAMEQQAKNPVKSTTDSGKELSGAMAVAKNSRSAEGEPTPAGGPAGRGGPGAPSKVVLPTTTNPKPIRNDSSTSSQWYDSESK